MLATRFATTMPLTSFVSTLGRQTKLVQPVLKSSNITKAQNYATQARASRFARRQTMEKQSTIKEKVMAPAGETAFSLGKGMLLGASGLGLGALCFYGMGLSNQEGKIDQMVFWPQYVKSRIKDTYMYFGGGIGVTAMTAVAVSKNAKLMAMMSKNSMLAIGASFVAIIGSSMVAHSIPYKEGIGAKQLAWLVHAGLMGAMVAPITMIGGPILVRAAWYTAGVVGGLSTLAMCAPSEKFLNMGGPLACGFGLVFASSLAGMFLPPTTALGAGLYSISVYGGLVLFSMFLLYDTQKIIKKAETHPVYAERPFDPVNASMGIYADTLNIFIRIAMILAGGGNRRK